jgi:large subunit ribosomal protein L3
MINTLLGIKKQMTSTYDARGRRVGATIVEIAPNFVTQIKTTEGKDGYNAVQLGFSTKKSVKKPQIGHAKKAGLDGKFRWFREVRTEEKDLQPGTEIKLNQVFSIGDAIKVTGISKGKGFQGGVRRHGFHGGMRTHGQSDRLRAPGSIGSGTTPGRVYKGKRMAGHMGDEQVSLKNLEVVGLNREKNLLVIKGAIPGGLGSLITITKLGRIKGYTPPPEEKPSEEEEAAVVVEGAEVKTEESVSVEAPADNQAEIKEPEQKDDEQAPQDAQPKEGDQENAG